MQQDKANCITEHTHVSGNLEPTGLSTMRVSERFKVSLLIFPVGPSNLFVVGLSI